MERLEAQRRDGILRAFFEGKDWDGNEEFGLKRDLVHRSHELLPDWPYLVEDEWECVDNATDLGMGDLVFADGNGSFAVVEVKHLSSESGKTARRRRTMKRRRVGEQANAYARAYLQRPGVADVTAFVFTNEAPFLKEVGRQAPFE